MSMIQIRNVPDDLHDALRKKALASGLSLSDFLLREVREIATRLSPEELRSRIESRQRVQIPDIAEVVREAREDR